ncbi:spry domain-containing related, partial [Cystoisospora suis]
GAKKEWGTSLARCCCSYGSWYFEVTVGGGGNPCSSSSSSTSSSSSSSSSCGSSSLSSSSLSPSSSLSSSSSSVLVASHTSADAEPRGISEKEGREERKEEGEERGKLAKCEGCGCLFHLSPSHSNESLSQSEKQDRFISHSHIHPPSMKEREQAHATSSYNTHISSSTGTREGEDEQEEEGEGERNRRKRLKTEGGEYRSMDEQETARLESVYQDSEASSRLSSSRPLVLSRQHAPDEGTFYWMDNVSYDPSFYGFNRGREDSREDPEFLSWGASCSSSSSFYPESLFFECNDSETGEGERSGACSRAPCVRIGWGSRLANLFSPIGTNCYGYSISSYGTRKDRKEDDRRKGDCLQVDYQVRKEQHYSRQVSSSYVYPSLSASPSPLVSHLSSSSLSEREDPGSSSSSSLFSSSSSLSAKEKSNYEGLLRERGEISDKAGSVNEENQRKERRRERDRDAGRMGEGDIFLFSCPRCSELEMRRRNTEETKRIEEPSSSSLRSSVSLRREERNDEEEGWRKDHRKGEALPWAIEEEEEEEISFSSSPCLKRGRRYPLFVVSKGKRRRLRRGFKLPEIGPRHVSSLLEGTARNREDEKEREDEEKKKREREEEEGEIISYPAFEGLKEGDVVGCYIHLPGDEPYAVLDDPRGLAQLWTFLQQGLLCDVTNDATLPIPVKYEGSFVSFSVNGVLFPRCFSRLNSIEFHPAVSVYNGASARLNLGPSFKYLSPAERAIFRPACFMESSMYPLKLDLVKFWILSNQTETVRDPQSGCTYRRQRTLAEVDGEWDRARTFARIEKLGRLGFTTREERRAEKEKEREEEEQEADVDGNDEECAAEASSSFSRSLSFRVSCQQKEEEEESRDRYETSKISPSSSLSIQCNAIGEKNESKEEEEEERLNNKKREIGVEEMTSNLKKRRKKDQGGREEEEEEEGEDTWKKKNKRIESQGVRENRGETKKERMEGREDRRKKDDGDKEEEKKKREEDDSIYSCSEEEEEKKSLQKKRKKNDTKVAGTLTSGEKEEAPPPCSLVSFASSNHMKMDHHTEEEKHSEETSSTASCLSLEKRRVKSSLPDDEEEEEEEEERRKEENQNDRCLFDCLTWNDPSPHWSSSSSSGVHTQPQPFQ